MHRYRRQRQRRQFQRARLVTPDPRTRRGGAGPPQREPQTVLVSRRRRHLRRPKQTRRGFRFRTHGGATDCSARRPHRRRTRRLPPPPAGEVCIGTRWVQGNRPDERFRVEARAETPPRRHRRQARPPPLSLSRERFAEKRASGSRPRRVVRRSCLRPNPSVRPGPSGRPLSCSRRSTARYRVATPAAVPPGAADDCIAPAER